MSTFDRSFFNKFFVGYNDFIDHALSMKSNFPHYNIRSDGPNRYVIEIALAGYKPADIDIGLQDGFLTVKTSDEFQSRRDEKNAEQRNAGKVMYNGLSQRAFNLTFSLAKECVVQQAKMADGMLEIFLGKNVNSPTKIPINVPAPTGDHPQYLTENNFNL